MERKTSKVKAKKTKTAAKKITRSPILKKHTNLPLTDVLQSILSGITDGFFATDRNLNFTLVNPVFAKLAKMKPGDIVGKNMLELFPFMKGGVLVKKYRKVLQTQRPSAYEHINLQNAKQVFNIQMYPRGKGLFVYYKDISISKQAEALVAASELRSRLVIENSYDSILLTNVDGGILSANPAACALFQMTEVEICKAGRSGLVDVTDPNLASFLKRREEEGAAHGELRMKRKDGSIFLAEITSKAFVNENGSLSTNTTLRDITELKLTQENLRINEERWDFAIEGNNDGVWDVDLNTNTILLTKRCKEMLGYSEEEIGNSMEAWIKLIHPEDLPSLIQARSSAIKSEVKSFSNEHRKLCKDGSWKWVQLRGTVATRDKAGNALRMIGTYTDISVRRQQEQDLQLKKFTINHSSDGIYWIRPDGSFADANLAAVDLLGYSFDELIKMSVPMIDDHYNEELWPHHWQELREKKHLTFETEMRKKGRGLMNVEINANYIVFNGEEFNCTFVRDITERKNAERQLIESENKYRLLANNMQDMVCLHSPEGMYEFVSPSAKIILGYEPKELIGKDPYSFFHPDDIKRIMEDSHQLILEKNLVSNITYQIKHKKGHYVWFETKAISIYDEKNQLIAIQTSSRDVTLRKEVEKKLTISNTRLKALFSNAINGIILSDDQGNYLDGNTAICEMLNYSRQEFVQLNVSAVMLSSEPVEPQFGEFVSAGREQGLIRLKAKSGAVITARYNAVANILPGVHLSILEDVTESQQVEKKLAESQNRLVAFFQSTTDAIILIDKDFKIIDFNKVANQFAEQLIGKSLAQHMSMLEFTTPATEEAFKVDLLKAFQGEIVNVELEIFYPATGHQIWWKVQYIPIKNDKNEIDAIAFNATNIDKEKRANQRLVNLTDNIPSGAIYEYRTNRDGTAHKFTYMSQGAQQLFEMDPQKLIDDVNLAFSLVAEEDISLLMQTANVAIQNLSNLDIQYRIKVPSGKIKWIKVSAKPRKLPDDAVMFEGIAMDITHQKNLEAEQAKAKLILQDILDNMINGVVQANAYGKITYANKWACNILGVKRNEIEGEYYSSIPWNQMDAAGNTISADQLPLGIALAQKKRVEKMTHGIVNDQGALTWLTVNANPLIDSAGNLTGAIASFEDITETRALEFNFRKNAEQMRFAATIAKMGEWELDLLTMTPVWSDEVCRIHEVPFGYRPDLKEAIEFYTDEFKPVISQAVERCIETGEPVDLTLQIITKTGNRKWVRTVGFREVQNNKPTKLYGLFQDIDETKVKEIELERLALIAKKTDNLVVVTNASREITWVNDGFVRVTGFTAEEVIGRRPGDLLQGPETDKETIAFVRQKLEAKEPVNFEIVNYTKAGSTYWLQIEIQPLLNEAGEVTSFVAIQADITQRKKQEELLRKSESNLRTTLTRLTLATQSASIGVWEWDVKTNKQIWDNQTCTLYGVTPHEVDEVEGLDYLRHVIHEDDFERVSASLYKAADERAPFDVEYRVVWKDGSVHYIKDYGVMQHAHNGNSSMMLGVVWDITEQKTNDLALRESEVRLKEAQFMAKVGSWETDLSSLNVIWSEETYNIFELDINTFQASHPAFLEFVHPDDRQHVDDAFIKSLNTKIDHSIEHRIITYNGTIKIVEERWRIVHDTHDHPIIVIGTCQDITERKKQEAVIKKTNLNLSSIIEGTHVGTWEWNVQTGETDFSESWAQIIGYTLAELEPISINTWEKYSHPDDFLQSGKFLEKHFMGELPYYEFESRMKHKNGHWVWVLDRGKVQTWSADGKPLLMFGSHMDITKRKEAEEALKKSETRLQTIIQTEPHSIKLLNRNGELLEMNPAGLAMIEAENFEQVKGIQICDIVGQLHRLAFADLTKEVFKGNSGKLQFEITALKGTHRWLETHAVPMKNPDGVITALLGVTRDITESKATVKKLADERLLLRTIIDNLPINVYAKNKSHQKTLVNRLEYEYVGASSEQEVIGKNDLELYLKDSAEISIQEDQQVFSGTSILGKETLNLRKDGTQTWFLTSKVPLRNIQDEIIGLVGVSVDITERKKQEKALLASNHEKDLLIKEIHHRIKNNLQLISSVIFIRMSKMPVSKTRDFLDETRQKIKAIALIHENLIQTESLNKINISVYLNRLLTDLQIAYSTHEANITVAANIESIMVTTDVAINCSLIVNELFTNSMKHAFKDRQGGLISVSIQKQEDKLEFVMSDDGRGMMDDQANNVISFGMQLLDVFFKQLNAKVTVDTTKGTHYQLLFEHTV